MHQASTLEQDIPCHFGGPLVHAAAPPEERPATFELWLDGQRVRSVAIDPADPFVSALPLAHLSLGEQLSPGKHHVELRYDGQLEPSVELETRSWVAGEASKASCKAGGQKRSLSAQAPASIGVGGRLNMRVEFSGPKHGGGTIVVGASNLVEIDLGALGAWVGPERPLRSARRVEGRVELELAPNINQLRFDLPYRAIRRGRGHAPSVAWTPTSGQTDAEAIVVDPGELEID